MQTNPHPIGDAFGTALRSWRESRKMSQLELALCATVSQRHVSWLENGRSAPSREMVVRLCVALDVPLRERNVLLASAGFTGVYAQNDLDDPTMAPVRRALEYTLEHHNPYPALVADRHWNLRLTNAAMDRLLQLAGDPQAMFDKVGDDGQRNLARLTLHPQGLRPLIGNWDDAAPMFLNRLRCEAMSYGSAADVERVKELAALADLPAGAGSDMAQPLLPTLPLVLELGTLRLSLFSVISTFGTAQDVTADELRIETFYPADEDSDALLRQTAGAT
ncbi:MAG: helix-turn-helix domain-containing protein [Gammaproteobacteria bacterium]